LRHCKDVQCSGVVTGQPAADDEGLVDRGREIGEAGVGSEIKQTFWLAPEKYCRSGMS
jgi:hypothetical protein